MHQKKSPNHEGLNRTQPSNSSAPGGNKKTPLAIAPRATGPRTPAGKRRSRYNALKSGIFAKAALLEGESPTEFASLLEGLREDLQPEGTLETVLVENLAVLLWRKRRFLRAEGAEIANAAEFNSVDSMQAQLREAWDQSRAGESSGGMLRNTSNPFVLQEAIQALTMVRIVLETVGFRKDKDPWLLRKLYGLDHDNGVPLGVFKLYQALSHLATNPSKGDEAPRSPDELKKQVLAVLDDEIKRLEALKEMQRIIGKQRGEYEAIAALVPSQGALDRLVRYEAHLSREIDRTLSQLERLQRIRLGQAVQPPLRLEVSR